MIKVNIISQSSEDGVRVHLLCWNYSSCFRTDGLRNVGMLPVTVSAILLHFSYIYVEKAAYLTNEGAGNLLSLGDIV